MKCDTYIFPGIWIRDTQLIVIDPDDMAVLLVQVLEELVPCPFPNRNVERDARRSV